MEWSKNFKTDFVTTVIKKLGVLYSFENDLRSQNFLRCAEMPKLDFNSSEANRNYSRPCSNIVPATTRSYQNTVL